VIRWSGDDVCQKGRSRKEAVDAVANVAGTRSPAASCRCSSSSFSSKDYSAFQVHSKAVCCSDVHAWLVSRRLSSERASDSDRRLARANVCPILVKSRWRAQTSSIALDIADLAALVFVPASLSESL
jgi:hypothetical protein